MSRKGILIGLLPGSENILVLLLSPLVSKSTEVIEEQWKHMFFSKFALV